MARYKASSARSISVLLGLGDRGVEDDRELLASVAREQVVVAQLGPPGHRGFLQQAIALEVAAANP